MDFSADLTPERIIRSATCVFEVNEIKKMKVLRFKNETLTDHDKQIMNIEQSSSYSGTGGLQGKHKAILDDVNKSIVPRISC